MDWPSKRTHDLNMFFLDVEREKGAGYFAVPPKTEKGKKGLTFACVISSVLF
jgi:hypothetical protein